MRLVLVLVLVACSPGRSAAVPSLTLEASDGRSRDLRSEVAEAPATVLVFFDPHCPCMQAHEARLQALRDELAPRGVRWFMVDSEVGASVARDQQWVLPFPILVDPGGKLAKAMGAQYASYTVVVDRAGRVLYAGGIDDEKSHLTLGATPYLRDALSDILEGKPPRRPEGKALGCALELF